jgi:hypothetical protein
MTKKSIALETEQMTAEPETMPPRNPSPMPVQIIDVWGPRALAKLVFSSSLQDFESPLRAPAE